jgi:hypothetical protein
MQAVPHHVEKRERLNNANPTFFCLVMTCQDAEADLITVSLVSLSSQL